ncbi:unnamed protein product, partial [marine sediment metagenome]
LQDVSKISPGGVKAADRVSLTIADREFIVPVGSSGCGESTACGLGPGGATRRPTTAGAAASGWPSNCVGFANAATY